MLFPLFICVSTFQLRFPTFFSFLLSCLSGEKQNKDAASRRTLSHADQRPLISDIIPRTKIVITQRIYFNPFHNALPYQAVLHSLTSPLTLCPCRQSERVSFEDVLPKEIFVLFCAHLTGAMSVGGGGHIFPGHICGTGLTSAVGWRISTGWHVCGEWGVN